MIVYFRCGHSPDLARYLIHPFLFGKTLRQPDFARWFSLIDDKFKDGNTVFVGMESVCCFVDASLGLVMLTSTIPTFQF